MKQLKYAARKTCDTHGVLKIPRPGVLGMRYLDPFLYRYMVLFLSHVFGIKYHVFGIKYHVFRGF